MFSSNPHRSSSSVRLSIFTPLPTQEGTSSPSSSSLSDESPVRTQPPTPTRPRSRTTALTTTTPRHRAARTRPRASSAGMSFSSNLAFSPASSSSRPGTTTVIGTADPGSPPPYSPEPPELDATSPFLAKRAASSPHLHSPPLSRSSLHVYPRSQANSRRPSTSALHPLAHPTRHRPTYTRPDTDDDEDGGRASDPQSGDETMVRRSSERGQPGTLRERLFGMGRVDAASVRLVTTAPGVSGAGETETEGEDLVSLMYAMFSSALALAAVPIWEKIRSKYAVELLD
ncbi:hypothetical protein PHLCEN_2v7723 [Hermanssonia centrifuga]|uniref:Uncharacterized protein n=1 Tax=Hermanssonia centrifuga TaxID=98765 RepID=A0A2R6NVS0_9APHY|nr:hypothetical protein PHLCEN_2v7723 [Hermanssonia centrifuga]